MVFAGFLFHENSSSINAEKLTRVENVDNHVAHALSVVSCAIDTLLVRTSSNSSALIMTTSAH